METPTVSSGRFFCDVTLLNIPVKSVSLIIVFVRAGRCSIGTSMSHGYSLFTELSDVFGLTASSPVVSIKPP